MERIDLHNYESFILDFYEGNLSIGQSEQLMDFLDSNPTAKTAFDSFELISLDCDNISFPSKGLILDDQNAFQSPITAENVEDYCIAKLEGLLSEEKVAELTAFIDTHPQYLRAYTAYTAAFMPTEEIIFEDKSSLYYRPKVIYGYFKYVAIAAAVFIGFAIINLPSQVYFYESVSPTTAAAYSDSYDEAFANRLVAEDFMVAEGFNNGSRVSPKSLAASPTKKEGLDDKLPPDPTQQVAINEVPPIESIEAIEATNFDITDDEPVLATLPPNKIRPKTVRQKAYDGVGGAAIGMIKEEVLKNRPIIEAIAEEITAATNEKVKISAKKGLTKKVQEFALEIGSFGISKKY